jgi:ketosteroid isomerase-like protein
MSRENVEIVRRIYETDRDRLRDCGPWLHPELEIVPSPDFPEQRVLRGFEGWMEWVTRWPALVEDYEVKHERFWESGPVVVASVRESGDAGRSGVPVDDRFAHVWTLQDGLVVRIQVFDSPEQALEAVGLAE